MELRSLLTQTEASLNHITRKLEEHSEEETHFAETGWRYGSVIKITEFTEL